MSELYTPTAEEVQRTSGFSDELKLSGDGVFATLQGEGVSAGRPSVFLRLQNCNLHCGRDGEGWKCDAWYTWDRTTAEFWQETRLSPVISVADTLQESWRTNFDDETLVPNLVITGGEPLLQQRKLAKLLPLLPGWHTEVETNGTILPIDEFQNTQINCSPKLATSGNEQRARRRERVLQGIAAFPNHWFKFVVSEERDLEEIDAVMQLANGGDYSRVLLMSEGVVGAELVQRDARLEATAKTLGCRVTARNHIFWYGDKRAT